MCLECDEIFEGKCLRVVLTAVQIFIMVSGINNTIPQDKKTTKECLLFSLLKRLSCAGWWTITSGKIKPSDSKIASNASHCRA